MRENTANQFKGKVTMSMTAFNLYLLSRLDDIRVLLFVLAVIAAVVAIVVLLHVYVFNDDGMDAEEKGNAAMPWMKRCGLLFAFCALGMTLVPTTKEMLLILGVPAVLQNRAVRKDLPDLYDKAIKRILESMDAPKQLKKED